MKLSKTHYMTIVIMVVCALGFIGWDVYVVNNEIKGDSISAILYEASLRISLIPYLVGILLGHLFWPKKELSLIKNNATTGLMVCLYVGLIPMIFDIINLLVWKQDIIPLAGLMLGLLVGHFFWINKGKDGE